MPAKFKLYPDPLRFTGVIREKSTLSKFILRYTTRMHDMVQRL